MDYAALWGLDRSILYLNHGSFGACPTSILAAQTKLRLEMEREPADFLSATLPGRLREARAALCRFLTADEADMAFVPNATAGVNAVLRSLSFEPDDELLVTNQTYAACRKTVDFVAAKTGAHVLVAQLPFPVRSDEEIIAAVLTCVSPQTRLALLDHVTSPTALVMPLARAPPSSAMGTLRVSRLNLIGRGPSTRHPGYALPTRCDTSKDCFPEDGES